MNTRSQGTSNSHLHYQVQPFHLRSFRRALTFLPRSSSTTQPRPFPKKREVLGLLSTDSLWHDWDATFAEIDYPTNYQDLIVKHDYKISEQLEHTYYDLIGEYKHATLTCYRRFDTFLLKLVKYNGSEEISESRYEYYLTVLRMLFSVAERLSDLMTIGFEISPVNPDIHFPYFEAIHRACEVSRFLRSEAHSITWNLIDQGLMTRHDAPGKQPTKAAGKYKILQSEPLVDVELKCGGVSPRDDPLICD